MRQEDDPPDPAARALRRMAELEAENARLGQRLAEAERQEALLHEAQRRARNMLAVVRSVARRSAQTADTAESYAMHLDGRLSAFARAQAALARNPAAGVGLDVMLAGEFLAHAAHEGKRVSLSGPEVRLRGKAAETVWLAVHELAVNAVKFGALAAPAGHVAVTWRVEPGRVEPGRVERGRAADGRAGGALRLEWRETGTAPPDGPRQGGFGTEVIERTLAYELGAAGSLGFDRDGMRCIVVLPLTDEIVAPDAEALGS